MSGGRTDLSEETVKYLKLLVVARIGQIAAHLGALHITTDEANTLLREQNEALDASLELDVQLRETVLWRLAQEMPG